MSLVNCSPLVTISNNTTALTGTAGVGSGITFRAAITVTAKNAAVTFTITTTGNTASVAELWVFEMVDGDAPI